MWSSVAMDASAKHSQTSGSGNITEERMWKMQEPEDHDLCCEVVSYNISSCHDNMTFQTWAAHEGHQWTFKLDGESPMIPQPYTDNYRQLCNARNWRGGPFQEKPYQLVIQFQMVISESIHTCDIIWTYRLHRRNIVYSIFYCINTCTSIYKYFHI